MLLTSLFPLIVAVAANPSGETVSPTPQMWAGHHVVYGSRKVPVRGRVRTRMDTFVLAKIVERGDQLEIVEQPCDVKITPVGGINVTMNATDVPAAKLDLSANTPNQWQGSAENGWGDQDIDHDGHPGMTVTVDAPICSGKLYVSQRARTVARLHRAGNHISGSTHVSVHQTILGAEGACLSVLAKDTREVVSGPRAYVPVPPQTTCEQLAGKPWPVKATRD